MCALLTAPSLFAQGGYSGPAVSSRGMGQAGARGSEPISIRPYASVNAVADSGMLAVITDEKGQPATISTLYGVEANVGVYGSRLWRASRLGVDYQGNYRHYNSNTFFNGSDHLLQLDFSRQLNRRTGFQLRGAGGTSSRTVGGVFGFQGFDSSLLGIPVNDVFDNRSYFTDVSGSLNRTIGSRNSVNLGAGAFGVRRQSKFLVGVNGYRAMGDFSRQLSRRTTIGVGYAYIHVDYPRVFGEADMHSLQGMFGRQIGRAWNLSVGIGAFRTDMAGTRTVVLDPLIAELLGTNGGREAFNVINLSPMLNLGLSWTGRLSSVTVGYMRGASPGNGVLLLNNQESVFSAYTYTLSRRASVSGRAGVSRMKGIGAFSGDFRTYNGGAFFSYVLRDGLQFTSGVDFRKFDSQSSGFNRNGMRAMVGIAYSGGELPISFH
ncbi:MAG: hypothetical protein JNK87_32750 [Bryobacterales bacterium]|nr:hypothetical protein [Bryobacterales bacterium]